MLLYLLAVATAVLLALSLSACDQYAADKEEILAHFDTIGAVNNDHDGRRAVELYTQDTFDEYEKLIKLALSGTRQQVQALPCLQQKAILTMRARSSRAELRKLSGRQYFQHAVNEGWWDSNSASSELDWSLHRISINGAVASAEVTVEDLPTKIWVRFETQDGAWKFDEPRSIRQLEPLVRRAAERKGLDPSEYVLARLEARLGRDLPDSIWNPMR